MITVKVIHVQVVNVLKLTPVMALLANAQLTVLAHDVNLVRITLLSTHSGNISELFGVTDHFLPHTNNDE